MRLTREGRHRHSQALTTRICVLVMGFKVSPRTALGTAGGWADVLALRKEVSNDLHDRESTLERDRRFYQVFQGIE